MANRCMGFKELRDVNTTWRSVLHLGTRRICPKGSQISQEEEFFFLDKGQVRLTHFTLDGLEKILWYINEGCIFGETPVLDPMPTESFHVCVTDCVLYAFSKECLTQEISHNRPDLMLNLLHTMARKLRVLSSQASSLYVDDVLIRTCKFLGQRLVPDSNPLTANPGISRQEMASLLGVHRITLYKVLRQQEEQGLFGPFERHAITILKPEEFFSMVNS